MNKEPWLHPIKTCLDKIGIVVSTQYLIDEKAFERMKSIFYQESFNNIRRDDSKLRTFAKLKTNIGLENISEHAIKSIIVLLFLNLGCQIMIL